MGRKKIGGFSRTAILETIDKDKQHEEASKQVPRSTRNKKGTLKNLDIEFVEKDENLDEGEVFDEEEIIDENEDMDENEDLDELTRLMSVVDIDDDPAEMENQLNLAGDKKWICKK